MGKTADMEEIKRKFANLGLAKQDIEQEKNNKLIEINDNLLELSEIETWGLFGEDLTFAKNKAKKIYNNLSNVALELGKDFEEIYQRFAKQGSGDGIYEKLIEFVGFNKRTALRYRKRYNLFNLAKTSSGKQLIAGASTKDIDYISKLDEKEIINIVDSNISKKEFETYLDCSFAEDNESKKLNFQEKVNDTVSQSFEKNSNENQQNYDSEDSILDLFDGFQLKKQRLSEDTKEELDILLEKIRQILSSV